MISKMQGSLHDLLPKLKAVRQAIVSQDANAPGPHIIESRLDNLLKSTEELLSPDDKIDIHAALKALRKDLAPLRGVLMNILDPIGDSRTIDGNLLEALKEQLPTICATLENAVDVLDSASDKLPANGHDETRDIRHDIDQLADYLFNWRHDLASFVPVSSPNGTWAESIPSLTKHCETMQKHFTAIKEHTTLILDRLQAIRPLDQDVAVSPQEQEEQNNIEAIKRAARDTSTALAMFDEDDYKFVMLKPTKDGLLGYRITAIDVCGAADRLCKKIESVAESGTVSQFTDTCRGFLDDGEHPPVAAIQKASQKLYQASRTLRRDFLGGHQSTNLILSGA